MFMPRVARFAVWRVLPADIRSCGVIDCGDLPLRDATLIPVLIPLFISIRTPMLMRLFIFIVTFPNFACTIIVLFQHKSSKNYIFLDQTVILQTSRPDLRHHHLRLHQHPPIATHPVGVGFPATQQIAAL